MSSKTVFVSNRAFITD